MTRRRTAQSDGNDPMVSVLTDHLLRQWSTPNRQAPGWLIRIRRFAAGIRRDILANAWKLKFAPPRVVASFKSRNEASGTCLFRALAQFELRDSIISSCVAFYFRRATDHVFDADSLAFRAPSTGLPPTHHDAAARLIEFRQQQTKAPWVAEVDIRGFFDTVGHDSVRSAIVMLERKLGTPFDVRAKAILEAYLACYSFNLYARPIARAHAEKEAHRSSKDCEGVDISWPDAELQALGRNTRLEPIGVPQGGALSCFIANAVLDSADASVRNAVPSGRALYIRYCDDVILSAGTRAACQRMLDAYKFALRALKLPEHPLKTFRGRYRQEAAQFWATKSKAPYRWSGLDAPGCVPWCSFVGYQVRDDGLLRIRKESIRKVLNRHNQHVSDTARRVRQARRQGKPTLSDRQVMYRARQRLRSSSVGTSLLHLGASPSAICWAGGFRLLQGQQNPALLSQLRLLDRHRGQALKRLKRALAGDARDHNPLMPRGPDRFMQFEGRPYSYSAIVRGGPQSYGFGVPRSSHDPNGPARITYPQ
jgi:hypothetical protein